jgi:hypothetical protein
VALVASTISFVGCGGSPTAPKPPTPPPVPTVDLSVLSPEARTFLLATNIIPYKGVMKFIKSQGIRIWADPALGRENLVQATAHWTDITAGGLTFQIVESEAEAQIKLRHEWPAGLPEEACANGGPTYGGPTLFIGGIVGGVGRLANGLKPGCQMSFVSVIMTHEIGHILGLSGHHLPAGQDTMASPPSGSLKTLPYVREAVTLLYSTGVVQGAQPIG